MRELFAKVTRMHPFEGIFLLTHVLRFGFRSSCLTTHSPTAFALRLARTFGPGLCSGLLETSVAGCRVEYCRIQKGLWPVGVARPSLPLQTSVAKDCQGLLPTRRFGRTRSSFASSPANCAGQFRPQVYRERPSHF